MAGFAHSGIEYINEHLPYCQDGAPQWNRPFQLHSRGSSRLKKPYKGPLHLLVERNGFRVQIYFDP